MTDYDSNPSEDEGGSEDENEGCKYQSSARKTTDTIALMARLQGGKVFITTAKESR